MFIQDDLRHLKAPSGDWYYSLKFLTMFIGVVVGPLVLLAVGWRDTGLAWICLAIALLLLISLSVGFSMFRRETRVPSISPKYI